MKKEWTMEETVKMPVIALRGLTVFPNVLIHFDVSREISIKALEEAMASGDPVFLVGQKDIGVEYPEAKDLYTVGTVSNVRQILRTPGDNVRVMVEGGARGSLKRLLRSAPFLEAEVQPIQEEKAGQNSAKTEALIRSTYEMFRQYTELAPKTAPDLLINVLASEDPGYIADFIAQNIAMRNSDKQAILEELRPVRRLERLYRLLTREVEILGLDMEIQNRAREQMADNQRDYYLREQMKAIQAELGEGEGGGDSEIGDYRKKIAEAKLPDEVREKLEKELGRLAKQPFGSSEATVLRSYLDVCLELPWGRKTRERVSVEGARKALDHDHFGLDKVKERILECGQDLGGHVGGPGHEPEARPHFPGRRQRRGGDPGPPEDLCGLHARPDHRRHQPGGELQPPDPAGRDRQAGAGPPGRPGVRPAGGAGRGAEQHLPGQLPGGALRPVRRAVHHHRQHHRHHPPAPAGPDGGHRAAQLHRRGEASNCQALPAAQGDEAPRPGEEPAEPGSRASACWSAGSPASAGRRPCAWCPART